MVRICSTNVRGEECIYDIGGKARRRNTTRKTKIILKRIIEAKECVVWIALLWIRMGTSGGLL
jgi:hypothetical protein